MSKISRSAYQKVVEENKQLKKDIEILCNGNIARIILVKEKYRKTFKRRLNFDKLMKEGVREYIENNPEKPEVKFVKSLNN